MTTWTTKVNQRAPGSELTIAGEAHVIGEDDANFVYLNEVPLLESPSSVSIAGFTEVTSAPAAGQFQVTYTGRLTGAVVFNAANNGAVIAVGYKGRGSTFFARDINRIQQILQLVVPYQTKISGRHLGFYQGANTNGAIANSAINRMVALPLPVFDQVTVNGIGVDVRTAGNSGLLCRLGLYRANPTTGLPGNLLLDAGQVDVSTTGDKIITISQVLSIGMYWTAAVYQGSLTVAAKFQLYNTYTLWQLGMLIGLSTDTEAPGGITANVSGALPNPYPAFNLDAASLAPIVFLTVA